MNAAIVKKRRENVLSKLHRKKEKKDLGCLKKAKPSPLCGMSNKLYGD